MAALFILGTVNRNVLRLGASLGKPNTLATNTRKFDNVMCVCTRKAVDGRVVVVDMGVVVLPWNRLRPVPVLLIAGRATHRPEHVMVMSEPRPLFP
jgi:hypothetical protein